MIWVGKSEGRVLKGFAIPREFPLKFINADDKTGRKLERSTLMERRGKISYLIGAI